jgi:hypothetical protein
MAAKYFAISAATTTTLLTKDTNNTAVQHGGLISTIRVSNNHSSTAAVVSLLLERVSTARSTRTVNQTGGSGINKIIFDQENFVSQTDRIDIGDKVYDVGTGGVHGYVVALNPDSDNTKEIQINTSITITDDESFEFEKQNHYFIKELSIPAKTVFELDNVSFDINTYTLKLINTGSDNLTVRIE